MLCRKHFLSHSHIHTVYTRCECAEDVEHHSQRLLNWNENPAAVWQQSNPSQRRTAKRQLYGAHNIRMYLQYIDIMFIHVENSSRPVYPDYSG